MKKQPMRSRSGSGSTPPVPVRHQFDHEVPTVIHHPEEKMTALARLTRRIILEPGKYATWAWELLPSRPRSSWPRTGRRQARRRPPKYGPSSIQRPSPKRSPRPPSDTRARLPRNRAVLHAANEYYATAMGDLPNNRDVAVSNVKRAAELYDQIAKEAAKDSFLAPRRTDRQARCLEARNELAQAIEQYDLVVKNWPGSPEAEAAKKLADALKQPEAAKFYKELFAYSPPKVTLPPLGNERFNFPGISPGSRSPSSATVPGRPVEVTPPDINEIKPAPGTGQLPLDVFAPETKAETKSPPTAPRYAPAHLQFNVASPAFPNPPGI